MGLLRLLFKIDADASGLEQKLGQARSSMSHFAQRGMREFRTAFTTFFSIGALKRYITMAFQHVEKYATDKEFRKHMDNLGAAIDSQLVLKMMTAKNVMEQFAGKIMTNMIPTIVLTFTAIAKGILHLQNLGTTLGGKSVQLDVSSRATAAYMQVMSRSQRGFGPNQMSVADRAALQKEAEAARQKVYNQNPNVASSVANVIAEMIFDVPKELAKITKLAEDEAKRTISEAGKVNETAKTIAEAPMARTFEALAKIGGFTGTSGNDLMSISRRQLAATEKIVKNTDALNISPAG